MTERGRGNLKGAFGNVRTSSGNGRLTGEEEGGGDRGDASGRTVRRRQRAKTGKRSRPQEYGQANGLVRHDVLHRWEQAKADPRVRAGLERDLSEAGVEFKKGDPDFGAICERLLGEWLESVGYGRGA